MSANLMKRTLGVSYKRAWYLCHCTRAAMKAVMPDPLDGTIEVDETYLLRDTLLKMIEANNIEYKELTSTAAQADLSMALFPRLDMYSTVHRQFQAQL